MGRVGILKVLRKAGQVRDATNDCESKTLNRLQECEVKSDVVKQEHFAVSHRKLISK